MSNCQCCLKPHPKDLFQRYHSSIQTIKYLIKTCSILETILLEKHENFERFSSKLSQYLMQYAIRSNRIVSSFSQLFTQVNCSLENLTKQLYELECLIMKCSIWLKNSSKKSIRSQLKLFRKQFRRFEDKSNLITNQFRKDFRQYQTNYHQLSLQMDLIEYEHMKLVDNYIEFVSLIFDFPKSETRASMNDIDQWKNEKKIQIPWLSNEHFDRCPSEIEIKTLELSANENKDQLAIESNLNWSFIQAKSKENLLVESQSTQIPNRVRLAIEAIERNNKNEFPRERKS